MTCHICAGNTCLGECEPPIAYIENLEREVAELKAENQGQYEYLHKLQVRDNQNRVYINVLREALEDIVTDAGGCCNSGYSAGFVARNALASTPAQSLQVHDNEVIEQCVKVVESFKEADPYTGEIFTSNTNDILNECIEAIKELKG